MDFHQLLTECVKRSASDLHLKSGSRPIVRVHGHLEVQDDLDSVSRDFMRKTAMTLLGEIRYRNSGPCLCQRHCDGFSDATTAAGDQRHLAG